MASPVIPLLEDLDYADFPACRTFVLSVVPPTLDLNTRLMASAGHLPNDETALRARPYVVIADLLDIRDQKEWFVQAEGATFRSPERVIQGWRNTQAAEDLRLELIVPDGHRLASKISRTAGRSGSGEIRREL